MYPQSSSSKADLDLGALVITAAIDDVNTTFFTFYFLHAFKTFRVPSIAGLKISSSFFGTLAGNGEAVCIT